MFDVIPNTHRRRRRNSTVELSCVGGVYAPVGCRDPVYNSAAIGYGCRIVSLVTTADGCVHTADTTQLDFVVGKFVQTRRDCRQRVCIGFYLRKFDIAVLNL